MSDFQDFLTRKFAYVSIGEFKPGKFEEAKQIYDAAVSSYAQGFKGAYLLQEQGTEKGISVTFWESEESMKENINDAHKAIIKKMMPLFVNPPTTVSYEVVSEIPPRNESAGNQN